MPTGCWLRKRLFIHPDFRGIGMFPEETSDPYQFAQKERDAETGLWHFEARYLASQLSRFISVDPKYANPDGLAGDRTRLSRATAIHNLYAFAACNPLEYRTGWPRSGMVPGFAAKQKIPAGDEDVKNSNEGKRVMAACRTSM